MLEVKGLTSVTAGLRGRWKEVSFVGAGPGEMVGLLGPNGAGKTTTRLHDRGLLAPDRGRGAKVEGGVVRGEDRSGETAPGTGCRKEVALHGELWRAKTWAAISRCACYGMRAAH